MSMYNYYLDALKNKFEAEAILEKTEKKLENMLEYYIYKQEKGKPLLENGNTYLLEGVAVRLHLFSYDSLNVNQFKATLTYFISSKIQKYKEIRLKEAKAFYNRNKYAQRDNFKVPLCIEYEHVYLLQNMLEDIQRKEILF